MELIFQESPLLILSSNTFLQVQYPLMWEDVPLLEMGQSAEAGYDISYPVFDSQGVKIARVKGARIHITDEGKKANIRQRHEQNLLVCEVDGKPILELRKTGAAALQGHAEIYCPNGTLIKSISSEASALVGSHDALKVIGGPTLAKNEFRNLKVGIHLFKSGALRLGE